MPKYTPGAVAAKELHHDLPAAIFQSIFEAAPGLYLILSPDPDFTIVAVSDAYLKATNTVRAKILGQPLFKVFPDNPADPQATGVKNLTASLNNVLTKKMPDTMAVQKYDIPLPTRSRKKFEIRYWSPVNSPVLDRRGRVLYIIHSVIDVTEFVEMKQTKQEQVEVADQLRQQNKLFQAELEQGEKELEEHQKNEQEMREIDKLKSEFVKIASHQLRTPLTSIKWSSEDLLTRWDKLSDDQREQYVQQIHASNERMIALIRELLDISKIDIENFTTSAELVWLPPILDQVLADMAKEIEQKHINIDQNIDPNLSVMFFDPVWLRLIFQNLLTNAVKYSASDQSVTISVARQTVDVLISVFDSGCGIPEGQKSQIFSKFFRADNAKELVSEGSGVGLYITKTIVEGAGGSMWFDSTENKGSTFYVKIPIKYQRPAAKRG